MSEKGESSIGKLQRNEMPMRIKWVWNDDFERSEHDYHFKMHSTAKKMVNGFRILRISIANKLDLMNPWEMNEKYKSFLPVTLIIHVAHVISGVKHYEKEDSIFEPNDCFYSTCHPYNGFKI